MYEGYENDYGQPLDVDGRVAIYKTMQKPPIKWLIHNIMKECGICVLYGSSGSMKSYTAVDVGCRMVNGMDFHGRAMKKGNVLYVAGEAVEETYERIEAWCDFYQKNERPFVVPWALSVHSPDDMEALKRMVIKHNIELVIFDNLSDCSAGVRLNDPDDVSEKVKPHILSFVREAKCAVIFLHHTGHKNDHERGAKVLRDMADTTIKAIKQPNNFDLVWALEKVRRLGPQDNISFHFEDVSETVGIQNLGIIKTAFRRGKQVDFETGEIVEDSAPEHVIEFRNVSERLESYIEEQGGRAAISDVLSHFEWRRENGKPKQTYYDALKGLRGTIEKVGDDLVLVPNDSEDFGTAAD